MSANVDLNIEQVLFDFKQHRADFINALTVLPEVKIVSHHSLTLQEELDMAEQVNRLDEKILLRNAKMATILACLGPKLSEIDEIDAEILGHYQFLEEKTFIAQGSNADVIMDTPPRKKRVHALRRRTGIPDPEDDLSYNMDGPDAFVVRRSMTMPDFGHPGLGLNFDAVEDVEMVDMPLCLGKALDAFGAVDVPMDMDEDFDVVLGRRVSSVSSTASEMTAVDVIVEGHGAQVEYKTDVVTDYPTGNGVPSEGSINESPSMEMPDAGNLDDPNTSTPIRVNGDMTTPATTTDDSINLDKKPWYPLGLSSPVTRARCDTKAALSTPRGEKSDASMSSWTPSDLPASRAINKYRYRPPPSSAVAKGSKVESINDAGVTASSTSSAIHQNWFNIRRHQSPAPHERRVLSERASSTPNRGGRTPSTSYTTPTTARTKNCNAGAAGAAHRRHPPSISASSAENAENDEGGQSVEVHEKEDCKFLPRSGSFLKMPKANSFRNLLAQLSASPTVSECNSPTAHRDRASDQSSASKTSGRKAGTAILAPTQPRASVKTPTRAPLGRRKGMSSLDGGEVPTTPIRNGKYRGR
ncbi:hypothetical protein A4X09_0g5238 [Tilletia walkeri]|uniref:Uncharacterized protein n=1 Tax=Tilletia walkeri TaxID=117179 RepID=A0A8X7N7C2_9BASI|nr:hypothetical protein A4X09_0g5238 [Tilletia walkeri]